MHIYILNAYIQCNYALAHNHLEEFFLHFKGFQSANLATLIFKIIANDFMKERLFLDRLGQEPREGCSNGSKVYTFQSAPIFNCHYFLAWASIFKAAIYMGCSFWVFRNKIINCVSWLVVDKWW